MKPIASLSLDLDNQWSYMKTHGDLGWQSFPSYLDLVVPRVLEILRRHDLTITFFIVGQDAALAKNADALRSIAAAGHEIGNHSFKHEPWLQRYSPQEIDEEIAMAEAAIENATGARPIGFRGPGFSLSTAVLETLARRGYRYDCSTFPTFVGPLARAYYFRMAHLNASERTERAVLFGNFSDGFAPNKPYRWNTRSGELAEIPVTVVPGVRTPFHVSYLLYLDSYSRGLAMAYLDFALGLCRLTGTAPSILLHPLDFLGRDDLSALAFFPGMRMPGERKLSLVEDALRRVAAEYSIVPMRTHAERVSSPCRMRTLAPQAC